MGVRIEGRGMVGVVLSYCYHKSHPYGVGRGEIFRFVPANALVVIKSDATLPGTPLLGKERGWG